jgi:hypothetical protein
MSWKLNKNGVRPKVTLTDTEQDKLNAFMDAITTNGLHPATAAKDTRCKYIKLEGTENQYEIHLSAGNRATFTVDEKTETVTMLQVGGHT